MEANKTFKVIRFGAMLFEKAEKAIDKADKTDKIAKNKCAKEVFFHALMQLDSAAEYLSLAIYSAETGDESTAVYYAEKAKIMAYRARLNAEWAIKEAERGDNK